MTHPPILELPPPAAMGLPAQFAAWRPGQVAAIAAATDAPTRHTGLVLPTGFGKSLVYMGLAALTGWRTVILTSTKALQRQLERDFGALAGTVLVQGQRNYVCRALEPGGELASTFTLHQVGAGGGLTAHRPTVDHGPCHVGVQCSLRDRGCGYYDTLRTATHRSTTIVITNYAFWISLARAPIITLKPDLLVCDEAHAAPDALASALGTTLLPEHVGSVLGETLPLAGARTPAEWQDWAQSRAARLEAMLEGVAPRTRDAVIRVRRATTLLQSLQRIIEMPPHLLVMNDETQGGVKADVLWAADLAERYLWRAVPRVVLTSATMTPHTAELLGVVRKYLTLHEAGEGFPVERRPVYVSVPQTIFGQPVRVDHRMSTLDKTAWVAHIDAVLDAREDRKGIIHTVSYARRDWLLAHSRHASRMISHGRGDMAQRIAEFRAAGPGAVLVSPAVTTGYDFPRQDCEYQVIAKVPFADTRDPVIKARTAIDSQYPMHVAMQELVQMVGRGMRSADDQCETFIVDGHATWFLARHAHLAPLWFRRAVRRLEAGARPVPPPPLAGIVRTPGAQGGGTAGPDETE